MTAPWRRCWVRDPANHHHRCALTRRHYGRHGYNATTGPVWFDKAGDGTP